MSKQQQETIKFADKCQMLATLQRIKLHAQELVVKINYITPEEYALTPVSELWDRIFGCADGWCTASTPESLLSFLKEVEGFDLLEGLELEG